MLILSIGDTCWEPAAGAHCHSANLGDLHGRASRSLLASRGMFLSVLTVLTIPQTHLVDSYSVTMLQRESPALTGRRRRNGSRKYVINIGASLYGKLLEIYRFLSSLIYFARVLLNLLNVQLDQNTYILESQYRLRKDRETTAMIFTARYIQEKRQKQNVDLYMTVVDLIIYHLIQSFVMDILGKSCHFGCPPKFITLVP